MKNEKVDYTGVYIVKIDKLEKEIERLNNIINELESFINMALEIYDNVDLPTLRMIKDKIKELEGTSSE